MPVGLFLMVMIGIFMARQNQIAVKGFGSMALLAGGGLLLGHIIYRVRTWVVALAVMNLLSISTLIGFYSVNGYWTDRVLDQAEVHKIFRFDRNDPVAALAGPQIMVIEPGCRQGEYFIGTQMGQNGLIRYNVTSKRAVAAVNFAEAGNDIVVDCQADRLVAGLFIKPGAVAFFNLAAWPAPAKPSIQFHHPVVYITPDSNVKRYYILDEAQGLYAIDPESRQPTAYIAGPDEMTFDSRTGELTVLTEPEFDLMRLRYIPDGKDSRFEVLTRRSLNVPFYRRLQMYMITGLDPGTVLMTDLWTGTLSLFDRDLNLVRRKRIAPGVSGMALTADGKILAIGGYSDGRLFLLDAATWKVLACPFVGHRMRELRLSRDDRFVLVGTAEGGFRVDIKAALASASSCASSKFVHQ